MMKTIERSHMPLNLWEKISLSDNAEEADREVRYNKVYYFVDRCKASLLAQCSY